MTRGLDTIPAREKDHYPFTVKVLGEKKSHTYQALLLLDSQAYILTTDKMPSPYSTDILFDNFWVSRAANHWPVSNRLSFQRLPVAIFIDVHVLQWQMTWDPRSKLYSP